MRFFDFDLDRPVQIRCLIIKLLVFVLYLSRLLLDLVGLSLELGDHVLDRAAFESFFLQEFIFALSELFLAIDDILTDHTRILSTS